MSRWFTDAQLAGETYKDVVFRNRRIDLFLEADDRFIIVASKGMGKTLLLRLKRDHVTVQQKSIIQIPKHKESDYVDLGGSFKRDLLSAMRNQRFWEELWKLAIGISALLNFPHHLSSDELASIEADLKRASLPEPLKLDLANAFAGRFRPERAPSSVLVQLLREDKSRLENVRSSALHTIHELVLRYIVSACFIYIDSFDQALSNASEDDLEIWCSGQCGLLRAAWEISRHNQHIKVYVAIRQEAYASFSDAERVNIRGSVLLIEYTPEDLRNIFLKHIQYHEGLSSIEDFVGLPDVYNTYLKLREDVFSYIHRHTIGVPRWLAELGEKLADDGEELTTAERRSRLRNIVNRESARLTEDYLKSEMRPFFGRETPANFISVFIWSIGSTVLSFNNLRRLAESYGRTSATPIDHPFCLMYNFGLLGYVRREPASRHSVQYFRKPYEFDWNFDNILPIDGAGYYLLHPALNELIQASNPGFRTNLVRIGDSLRWNPKDEAAVRKDTLRVFVSYAHDDKDKVKEIVEGIENQLKGKCIYDLWFDEWKMQAGKWVQDQVMAGLRESDYVVLMVSRQSIGSAAVAVEWKTHFAKKLQTGRDSVLPLIIDDTEFNEMPDFIARIYARRCSDPEGQELRRFVSDLLFTWEASQEPRRAKRRPPT